MKNALELTQVSKKYEKEKNYALKSISFKVKAGDFFALLGPNGAGKSTTIGIISSIIKKTTGIVNVFDFDIDKKPEQAKLITGVVPQEFNFNMFEEVIDIVQNQAGFYGIPAKKAKPIIEANLKSLGLWEKRFSKARSLSGGMKRRLMIARSLTHKPKILILDEPTAGVDIELRESMWQFLEKINKEEGVTIILTTHYLEEAERLCRNIAIIDQGEISEISSMKDLLKKIDIETFVLDIQADNTDIKLESCNHRFISNTELEIHIPKNQCLNQVFQELDNKKITVTSMVNKQNRLEKLFLQRIKSKK